MSDIKTLLSGRKTPESADDSAGGLLIDALRDLGGRKGLMGFADSLVKAANITAATATAEAKKTVH